MNKKKHDDKIIYLIGAVILFIMILLLAGNLAYYADHSGNMLVKALNDLGRFRFHVGFTEVYRSFYKIAFFAGMLLSMVFAVEYEKYYHDASGIEAGSASWNKDYKNFHKKYADPIGKIQSDGPNNMILSAMLSLSIDDMLTRRNNNIILIGAAGTGKSRNVLIPNILQMNVSIVVTDPSGEILRKTKYAMEENGYKIRVFNLVNMEFSNTYNPFEYIRDDAGIGILVECFITNTTPPEDSGGEPFWKNSEKALLTATIYYLRDYCSQEDQNFAMILYMIQLGQIEENAKVKQMTPLDMLFEGRAIIRNGKYEELKNPAVIETMEKKLHDSLAWKNYQTFRLGGERTLKSILISAAVRLNPFNIPSIANLTCRDTMQLDTIGDEKTILYVIIPQGDKTYNFLASMMYSQLFECLYHKGEQSPNGRLKMHVRFLMDEFANCGKLNSFPEKISTMRKYNISATVILQSIAQIKTMYKDDYETVFGNCDTSILLGTQEQTTAEYFSKQLGKTTIRARSSGLSKGKKSGSSMNFQQTGRELMTMDEIRAMSNDDCLVFVRGEKPFLDKKYDLKKHPNYYMTGDADPEKLYDICSSKEFLNYHSKIIQEEVLKVVEEKACEAVISQPEPLSDMTGQETGFLFDGPIEIRDVDKKKTMECLTKSKEIVEKALQEIITTHTHYKALCTVVYGIELKMLPLFVKRTYNKYQKAVMILVNSRFLGNVEGYFIDENNMIRRILDTYAHVTYEKFMETEETEIYHVNGLHIEEAGELKFQVINGRTPRTYDDSLIDEYFM